jgi:putative ABC transport system permease protein
MPIRVAGMRLLLDFSFDWRVFAYAFGAALLSGIFVGVVPALRASASNLNDLLHEGGRMVTERRHRLRNTLVVAQIGGSLMLLIVAGLFARSLANVQHADLGFDADHVLNLSMNPNQAGYTEAQGEQLLSSLLDRVRTLPGIESASLAASVPLGGAHYGSPLEIEGYQPPAREQSPFAGENMVSSDYFATMRIPVLSGRGILGSDKASSQPVAVINEAMAASYWPGENPIGRRFTANYSPHHGSNAALEVVGVVKNSRTTTLVTSGPVRPYFYVPLAQSYLFPVTLQIRSADPLAMSHPILELIRTSAPMLPVFDVQTMKQALDTLNGLILFEIGAFLAASLGTLGLLLATVGVSGVVSYAANQRTHEIGIRAALGAQPKQILMMILRQGGTMVASGLVVGILVSVAMSHLVGNFLVGVSAVDPLIYFAVSALLATVALVACYLPARRAMKVDPVVALRNE